MQSFWLIILVRKCLGVYEGFLIQVISDTNFIAFLFTHFTIVYNGEIRTQVEIKDDCNGNKITDTTLKHTN